MRVETVARRPLSSACSTGPGSSPRCNGRTRELRVLDATDCGVVRVVKDVGRRRLPRARLDPARLDAGHCGATAVDPATGRAVAIRGFVDDPKAGHPSICYDGFGSAAPSGVYNSTRLSASSVLTRSRRQQQ